MLVLTERDVERLIDPADAIVAAIAAYRLHAEGGVPPPTRADVAYEEPKAGCLMLAGMLGADLLVKSNVHAYPGGASEARLWGGMVALWDLRTARLRALIAGRVFHDHRTAAGYAAGAVALAAREPRRLALFGVGKTAPMTLRYLKIAKPGLARVALVGRDPERVRALAARASSWPEFGRMEVVTGSDPETAVKDADIIATVTSSATPVFPGRAVRAGTLVILGGANRPTAREADDDLMRRARVVVDARHGAVEKAGDLALALASGALSPERIVAEIGTCFDHAPTNVPGTDVTVFKSMGLAVQDAVLAARLVDKAEMAGVGTRVDLEGAAPAHAA